MNISMKHKNVKEHEYIYESVLHYSTMTSINVIAALMVLLLVAAELATGYTGVQFALNSGHLGPDVFECGRVAVGFRKCYTYLKGYESRPLVSCCNSVKVILEMATSTEGQPLVCKCFKEANYYFDNLKVNAISELAEECHIGSAPSNCGS
ncbi:hypothetical protein K2173_014966 [Erythroxylum novogranatense]|uniref:Bifunctional inhibitor/plant lipid transfer protein/seed storage helical domain-containing protein n=1 Tax=Erythroxylum novogranatense TaxID=1862640 RepID=A0AAV8TWW9_9ROSI|nr:hypothetical protein K2173_014966 [Erythroxylum novogranatense]